MSAFFASFFVFTSIVWGSSFQLHKFTVLQNKDIEEMASLVKVHLQASEKWQEEENNSKAVEELEAATKLIFSRPDKDHSVAKLLQPVKNELIKLKAWGTTLNNVASGAIVQLNRDKLSNVYRATALFVLDNLMAEMRPDAKDNGEFRDILEKIKKADLDIPPKVVGFRQMRSMYKTQNPSKVAERILKKEK